MCTDFGRCVSREIEIEEAQSDVSFKSSEKADRKKSINDATFLSYLENDFFVITILAKSKSDKILRFDLISKKTLVHRRNFLRTVRKKVKFI